MVSAEFLVVSGRKKKEERPREERAKRKEGSGQWSVKERVKKKDYESKEER